GSVSVQEPDGQGNSHWFFRGESGSATPLDESTGRRPRGGSPGASRRSDEMERKTSGRHAGWSHLTVEFSSDESGPEDLRLALAYVGFHIAREEDMKNVVSQEDHQQKAFDGAGIMLEDVIGVPFVGQLVEAIILNIPSLVP